MKFFTVHGGEEIGLDMVQGQGILSLVKTKTFTFTFGGPQVEPQESPDTKPEDRTVLPEDSVFQLYTPECVYYSGADGEHYASCRTYRLAVDGRGEGTDSYSFSCAQSPIRGHFEAVLSDFCEK